MLEAAVFLGALREADVEWLVANSTQHEIQSGAVLINRGEPVEFLYLVVDGAFDVTVLFPDERHVATLYAGELIGEMSFVDRHPPSATVRGAVKSRVLAVPKIALTGKIRSDHEFGARFYLGVSKLLAGRLRAAYSIDDRTRVDAGNEAEMEVLARRFEEIQRHLGLRRLAQGS